jgi:hypothetical protein
MSLLVGCGQATSNVAPAISPASYEISELKSAGASLTSILAPQS